MINKTCPSNMENTGYVLYCRKSSESEDRQAASLDDQIAVLSKLAKDRNLVIEKIFAESKSAKAPGRPVFNEMLEYIKAHHSRGIVCWQLNRLFRNPLDEGAIRWMIGNGDISEIVTPSKIYLEADSDFLMAVEGAQASRFIKDLRANTRRGTEHKLRLGLAPIRAYPGYMNRRDKPQGQRDIEPDPVQFPLWKKLFALALTGSYSQKDLYTKALAMGLQGASGRKLTRSTFYHIFQDPIFYTGRFRYDGIEYEGKHTPMLNRSEYDALKKIFCHSSRPESSPSTRAYNGLMKCECGRWMTGERHTKKYINGTSQTFFYYRCVHHKGSTKASIVSLPSLVEQVQEQISKVSIHEKYIDLFIDYLGRLNKERKFLVDAQQKSFERQLHEVSEKIDRLVELYISSSNKDHSLLSDEEFRSKKTQYAQEKLTIEENLRRLSTANDVTIDLTAKTFRFVANARERFEKGSSEDRIQILRTLCSNLVVRGKEIDMTLRPVFASLQRHLPQEATFEPTIRSIVAAKTVPSDALNPIMYPIWDSVRTYIVESPTEATEYAALLRVYFDRQSYAGY